MQGQFFLHTNVHTDIRNPANSNTGWQGAGRWLNLRGYFLRTSPSVNQPVIWSDFLRDNYCHCCTRNNPRATIWYHYIDEVHYLFVLSQKEKHFLCCLQAICRFYHYTHFSWRSFRLICTEAPSTVRVWSVLIYLVSEVWRRERQCFSW